MMNVLVLDSTWQPRHWASLKRAVSYYAKGKVRAEVGSMTHHVSGGRSRAGDLSAFEVNSILVLDGRPHGSVRGGIRLNNRALFARDRNVCAFCGNVFATSSLTREHIVPVSKGGANTWMNCVSTCAPCNHRKGSKTLEQAGVKLLYLPYTPSPCEALILRGRNILADQMNFLMEGLPRGSRLR